MSAERIADLERLVAKLEADRKTSPPSLQREIDQGVEYAREVIAAMRGDEGAQERLEEPADGRNLPVTKRSARFLRDGAAGLARFQSAVWVLDAANIDDWRAQGGAGQVWIRWDGIPAKDRDAVVSLASAWKDIVAGRPRAGRKEKNPRS